MKSAVKRDGPFLIALMMAALIHVSMVTVFSIVVRFPKENIVFYNFEIVDTRTLRTMSAESAETLSLPPLDGRLATSGMDALTPGHSIDRWQGLPAIEVPAVRFAELERIRLRERGLRLRSELGETLAERPQDSWRRFSKRLALLGGRLSSGLFEKDAAEETFARISVGRPIPGVDAYIEWMSEPKDRPLIFAPPIQAPWGIDPITLDEPMALLFRVNPEGAVVEVQLPIEDEAGVVLSAARALEKYKFQPLASDAPPRDQRGTFLLGPSPPGE